MCLPNEFSIQFCNFLFYLKVFFSSSTIFMKPAMTQEVCKANDKTNINFLG